VRTFVDCESKRVHVVFRLGISSCVFAIQALQCTWTRDLITLLYVLVDELGFNLPVVVQAVDIGFNV
jgi:hypothetical protein